MQLSRATSCTPAYPNRRVVSSAPNEEGVLATGDSSPALPRLCRAGTISQAPVSFVGRQNDLLFQAELTTPPGSWSARSGTMRCWKCEEGDLNPIGVRSSH